MKSKKLISRGFSLTELLVTLASIGVLSVIGMRYYKDRQQGSHVTWAKAEVTKISQLMKAAKSYDGYYHQFIYTMGYEPKGKVFASAGTDAAASVCCNKYPDPGTKPCRKGYKGGFLYYNCGNSATQLATDNIEICDSAGYSHSCDKMSGLSVLKTSDFSTCPISPASWCDCNQFTAGAITSFDKEMTLNHVGKLCLEK